MAFTDYAWQCGYHANDGSVHHYFNVTIPAGTTAILIAILGNTSGGTCYSTIAVTFDGATAPLIPGASVIRTVSNVKYQRIDVQRVFGPATGVSKQIHVTLDVVTNIYYMVACISGGKTNSDADAWGTVVTGVFGSGGADPSVTASSATGDEVIDFCNSSWPDTDTLVVGADQTEKHNGSGGSGGGGFRAAGSRQDGAASVVMSWTKNGGNSGTAQLAIPCKAAPASVSGAGGLSQPAQTFGGTGSVQVLQAGGGAAAYQLVSTGPHQAPLFREQQVRWAGKHYRRSRAGLYVGADR